MLLCDQANHQNQHTGAVQAALAVATKTRPASVPVAAAAVLVHHYNSPPTASRVLAANKFHHPAIWGHLTSKRVSDRPFWMFAMREASPHLACKRHILNLTQLNYRAHKDDDSTSSLTNTSTRTEQTSAYHTHTQISSNWTMIMHKVIVWASLWAGEKDEALPGKHITPS